MEVVWQKICWASLSCRTEEQFQQGVVFCHFPVKWHAFERICPRVNIKIKGWGISDVLRNVGQEGTCTSHWNYLLFSCKDLHSWRSRNCLACSCASLLHVAWTSSSTHVWDNLAACDKSSSWQGRSAHYGAAEGWRSAEQSPRYYSSNSNAVLKPFSRVWRMELQDRRIVALLCTDTRGTSFLFARKCAAESVLKGSN